MPIKRIAGRLNVSPSSVLYWTQDIKLTQEQRLRNSRGPLGPQNPGQIRRRVEGVKRSARARRLGYQQEGRERARQGDSLHLAGCMLYWAEGSKGRNRVTLCNSDAGMLAFFRRFLVEALGVSPDRLTLRLHVYVGNGLSIAQIEDYWLGTLELPRTCLRKHAIDPLPTSSSGKKKRKLPYGVATLALGSTRIVQHIYGAIQEYGGFEEPKWLDGPPRKSKDA